MKLKNAALQSLVALLLTQGVVAQEEKQEQQVAGLNQLATPDFSASLAVGFNYDYLRSPLRVDYERARGMFGINIPFSIKPSSEMIGTELMGSVSDNFTDGEYFAPSLAVKQFANTTLQVDVPFYGGVLEWSHMRMMNVKYNNRLGLPDFEYAPDTLPGAGSMENMNIDLLLKGNISVPVGFDLGWESMTFGYAYKFNDMFKIALNLHRHYFYFDVLGDVDINIAGNIDVTAEANGASTSIPLRPDYSLHNQVDGFYDLKKWTPTIAGEAWRFQFIGRFGFKDKATGSLSGGYVVPFFIDPMTFQADGLTAEYITENMGKFQTSDTNQIQFNTSNDLKWEMPSAFTLGFDIVPSKLNLSYTKFAGQVRMELVDYDFQKGDAEEQTFDTLDVRIGATVDHMVLMQGYFSWMFFKMGIFAFDIDFGDKEQLIRNSAKDVTGVIPYGKGIMVPIASGGILLGDKMQFKLEGHLVPFPAMNTGLIYHF